MAKKRKYLVAIRCQFDKSFSVVAKDGLPLFSSEDKVLMTEEEIETFQKKYHESDAIRKVKTEVIVFQPVDSEQQDKN